ncbi:exopolysaccharide production repressor protein [Mesorhizobium erdmanii]|nr:MULTISPECIES: exopolysaccharide production repressor protein [Mesorhizobium]
MSATTIVVAVWTYMATGSFWQALVWTAVTLIILQAGYFLLFLGLILRRARDATTNQDPVYTPPPLRRDGVWF